MAIDERSRVIGAFRDRKMAEQAVEELRQEGWPDSQIRIYGERSSGGVLSSLKQAFTDSDDTMDDVVDDFDQLNLPDEQRRFYRHELSSGYSVVAIAPLDRQLDARDILNRHGAYNVYVPTELGGKERVVPIRREETRINKNVVQVGEVRIHKRVITEEKTFTVPVTREEVTIERLPIVDRDADSTEGERQGVVEGEQTVQRPAGPAGEASVRPGIDAPYNEDAQYADEVRRTAEEMLKDEGTIRILVREDRVQIAKYPVVVEEIVVRKQMFNEMKEMVEPLRHEEVSVERTGNARVRGDGLDDVTP